MKKFLSLILTVCMMCGLCCLAAAEEPEPVTADELAAWAESLKALALESAPVNDPTSESADTEDGYLLVYPFAALYADQATMTADTKIVTVSIEDDNAADDGIPEDGSAPAEGAETPKLRGLELMMWPAEVAALFPTENPDMAGNRTGAVLYLREEEDNGVLYGRVYRDGQRVGAIEYGQLAPTDDGYRMSSLTCFFTEGMLSDIRAEGLNGGIALTDADKDAFVAELRELDGKDEYIAVKTSRDGSELAAFSADDLMFSGLRFLTAQPEDLPGIPEQEEIEDEGSTLLRVDGDGYTAVFRMTDGQAEIVSFTILDEALEGPRGVRLGDRFHEDWRRFRHEDREGDSQGETLYGEPDTAPYGVLEYGDAEDILRFVTGTPDGREVELLLRYENYACAEITIRVR